MKNMMLTENSLMVTDSGVAEEVARLFDQREEEKEWYNNNPEGQTAALDVYERQVVPIKRENELLTIEVEEGKMADLVGDLGIINRKTMNRRLVRMTKRAMQERENGEVKSLAKDGLLLVMADLDDLKGINESSLDPESGHIVGDAALYAMAEVLVECLRPEDVLGRVGGDEFMAMVPIPSEDVARKMMEGSGKESSDPGLIVRLNEEMEERRGILKRRYGEAWPSDREKKKPGQISTGWKFLSWEELIKRYWQYETMPKVKENGSKHDLVSLALKEADQQLLLNKKKK